jgi:endonuclease-3
MFTVIMQLSLGFDMAELLPRIDRRLRTAYGAPPPVTMRLDPVSQLVLSMLGARTRGEVSLAVFERLRRRFGDWDALRDSPPSVIEPLIAPVTFAENKAAYLVAALRAITTRRGALDLDFLRRWPVEAARYWLETLPGVGPKVSASVVNFSTLGMRALVVDTHHFRVARRIGLLSSHTGFPNAHRALTRQLPDGWEAEMLDAHHELMKLHGQVLCRHDHPICGPCPVRDLCATHFRAAARVA